MVDRDEMRCAYDLMSFQYPIAVFRQHRFRLPLIFICCSLFVAEYKYKYKIAQKLGLFGKVVTTLQGMVPLLTLTRPSWVFG